MSVTIQLVNSSIITIPSILHPFTASGMDRSCRRRAALQLRLRLTTIEPPFPALQIPRVQDPRAIDSATNGAKTRASAPNRRPSQKENALKYSYAGMPCLAMARASITSDAFNAVAELWHREILIFLAASRRSSTRKTPPIAKYTRGGIFDQSQLDYLASFESIRMP